MYQLLSDSLLLQFDGKKVCATYNYQNDPMLQDNIAEETNTEEMETYLRAYIQQYIYRLISNQLTIDNQ